MDIEKLIAAVKLCGSTPKVDQCRQCAYWSGGDMSKCIPRMTTDVATALSTLQAENEELRETVDKYATAARVIALHLKPFCDESLLYDEMIADAARKASDELEQVKRECDEAVQCIRGIAKSGRVWMCPYCVHAKDTTGGIAEYELDVGVCMMPYSRFEWRVQMED